jgi:UDP-N-acetylmuramoyl-L-alanyl-D-glutamate--2,6-diaminopimelate ligase
MSREPKFLLDLLENLTVLEHRGPGNPAIHGLHYDSRQIGRGDLFVALEGLHTDGHDYIAQAAQRGAAAVLYTRPLDEYIPGLSYVRLREARTALSTLSDRFFDHPSRRLKVIGVTGTNGKSSVVWFIHQFLEALGKNCGFLSTVWFKTGTEVVKNSLRQSTPEAPEIQMMLKAMLEGGMEFAVLEATSHGLSERTRRLADVRFAAAVLTNISHEHLEFHGSLEQYCADKANLFRALDRSADKQAFGVVNLDERRHAVFRAATGRPTWTYSISAGGADLRAEQLSSDLNGSSFTLVSGRESAAVRLNHPGRYNVENLLAAVLTVQKLLDIPLAELVPLIPRLRAVKGRMESVEAGQQFRVIVDYAHTPDSFEKLLPLVKQNTPGALLAVFGSAGERDTEKRARQGSIAARYCDTIVLADEDPRGEDGLAILHEIASGCPDRIEGENLFLEADRRRAIRLAFRLARRDDTVLLLGKGHEQSIIYARGSLPWDEAEVARSLLEELGYGS